jgi:hypothetical protein
MIERIASEAVLKNGRLRQVSAAELILSSMLPEMIAAERESGSSVAETLQLLLEKFSTHLSHEQRYVLAGVAILEKMRVGKQSQNNMDYLLCEATALNSKVLSSSLQALSQELGAIEWNRDLGQYELIADASTRGQFQQWLRKQQGKLNANAIRDLFVRRGATDTELGNIATDFALRNDISTQEWYFDAQFAHSHILEKIIQRVFQDWEQATTPTDTKGKVIYAYIHPDEDINQIEATINKVFSSELLRTNFKTAPIWVIGISDQDGILADHIGRLHLFDEQMNPDDKERFRRFVPEEIDRSRQALKDGSQEAIKRRLFWVSGLQDIPEGRLKQVGDAIFSTVYPNVLPFPFDGFATSAGGGAGDCAQLTRSLIARQVDGNWVQAQPKRLQNRVSSLLVRSWQVLSSNGKLTEPVENNVKAVFEWLQQSHQADSKLTLYKSLKALTAPPYGMNAASAGLMLGLMLGGVSPPRRIERMGEIIASSDWVNEAFPAHKGRHFLEKSILEQSTLRFLSEDSEGRWRSLLNRWEMEKNYQTICDIAKEANQTRKVEPLPEILEGTYLYLRDRAEQILLQIKDAKADLDQWEHNIEKAERQNAVGELLKVATLVIKKKRMMEDGGCWPEKLIYDGDILLSMIHHILSGILHDWILRQSCNSTVQVSQFRYHMEKNVESLILLGFKSEAQVLEGQAQRSIAQVEAKQKFSMTLDESEDYSRQSNPTESTPVRDLRDAITKGDDLIKGIQGAHSVLKADEINARIKAIETRQSRLREILKRHTNILGDLFSLTLENETALRDTLVKADRLRKIFIGTPDESEVADIVKLLERILKDIAVWESNNISPERLEDLLKHQSQRQLSELNEFLEINEIESPWDVGAIYNALARERINAALKCSTDWLAPRTQLTEQINSLDLSRCITLEKELIAAPEYLSDDGREKVNSYLLAIRARHTELSQQLRHSKISDWQKQFFSLKDIQKLSKYEAEQFLKLLNNPPTDLTIEEKKTLQPIETQIISQLDQISVDEIISRIDRLPIQMQRQLLVILSERLV